MLASVTTNHTNLADVYGGGGKLIGGSYLICLYVGMMIGKYYVQIKSAVNRTVPRAVLSVLSITGAVFLWNMMCTKGLILDITGVLGGGFNPPGICFISYAICVLFAIWMIINWLELPMFSLLDGLLNMVSFIGTQTLYIFLYHRLFLDYVLQVHFSVVAPGLKVVIYFGMMIGGSILLGLLLKLLKRLVLKAYQYKVVQIDNK